jgi:hypothetical protein
MRRKLVVLTVGLLVVLLLATPGLVAAKGGHGDGGQGGTWFNVYGTIASLDDPVIYTVVTYPDRLAGNLTVYTNDDTIFKECGGTTQIGFADLQADDSIRIVGIVDDGNYVATKVIVGLVP